MMYRKEKYIDELIHKIQTLETRVVSVKNEDALSFSFFRDAFQKVQDVMRLLHELEMQQIEDMKNQMEKLVIFLSENETPKEQSIEKQQITKEQPEESITESIKDYSGTNKNIVEVNLPIYKNPRKEMDSFTPTEIEEQKSELSTAANDKPLSLSDTIQSPPSKIEVKRSLSLNDRFFYQRELFDNNRGAMNEMMERISQLDSIKDIESILRKNTTWDFEDENVKSFIELLEKIQD